VGGGPGRVPGGKREDHRRDDGAGPPRGLVDDAYVGAVLHEDDDAVAGRDLEAARDAPRTLVQLAGTVPAPLEEKRLVVAVTLERPLGEPREVELTHRARPATPSAPPT